MALQVSTQPSSQPILKPFVESQRRLQGTKLSEVAPGIRWQTENGPTLPSGNAYDLESLLSIAAANNPTIRQARYQISGTLAQALQAGLYPNPRLSYVAENIGSEGTAGEFQGLEVTQRFVTAHKLDLSRRKYLKRAKVAEHLAMMQQFKVCNDVRIHFAKALAAQQTLAYRQEILKTAEDNYLTTRELFNLGQANEVDVHRINADLRRHQLAVLAAENRLFQERMQLSAVIGVDLSEGPLEGELTSPRGMIQLNQAMERILTQSPEVLAAYAKLSEDRTTIRREEVEWVPDLVVSGGSGYNFESEDPVASARLEIEVPLYDKNQGTIKQAYVDYCRQQKEVRRTEMHLRMRLAEEYEQYITALQHIMSYEETVLPESKAAYESALHSYKVDRTDWPRVLEMHREYTMRRIEYVAHLVDRRVSEVLIDGFLLHGGLEAASNPNPPGHIDSTPNPR
ncbi:Cation efflux system protein CzcC [Planctomycetales bacterium 10988]|nr:Cation efflux system protein CzcC [Planctomycetales bacterium 10988]